MTDFPSALKTQLEADPALRRRGRHILEIINARPSQHRMRVLERMERHARVTIGVGDKAKVDWAGIDWSKWLPIILQMLLALLPLILAL